LSQKELINLSNNEQNISNMMPVPVAAQSKA